MHPEDEFERPTSGIQVLSRAAEILRAIGNAPGGLSQAELTEQLGLARTTVHRIVNALIEEGFIAAGSGRSRYRLGPEFRRLLSSGRRDFIVRVHPFVQELSREIGETVDVSVLDGNIVHFLDQVTAPNRLQAVSAVGEAFPLHSCAPGKALLAAMKPSRLSGLLNGRLEPLTSNTLSTPAALREELRDIQLSGVAFDREEHSVGICAAAIVLSDADEGDFAISVPMPAQRFYGNEKSLADMLLAAAARWEQQTRNA